MPILHVTCHGDRVWPGIRNAAPLVLVYKHSARCGLSWFARRVVRAFATYHPDLLVAEVDVLEECELSATIAAQLAIPHASPQVILLRSGRPVWTASHTRIELDAMERAWCEYAMAGERSPPPGPPSLTT
jgi:bacillithiol system protein YtxJ